MTTENDRHFLTGTIWKGLQENFHPNAKQLVQLGRSYEKAQIAVASAANSYFDAIEHIGQAAINTSTSTDIGNVFCDVSKAWRHMHNQQEQLLRSFHREVIVSIEKRLQQSIRTIPLAYKDYSMGYKVKSERCDKARGEWKKYQKKSLKSTNLKYEQKNRQSQKVYTDHQARLDEHIQLGNRMASLEERSLYSYIADKHCAIIRKQLDYHSDAVKLLGTKLEDWSEVCHTNDEQKNDINSPQRQGSEPGANSDDMDPAVANALKHMSFLDSKEYTSQTLPHPPKRDNHETVLNRPLQRYPSSPNVCKESSVETVVAKYTHEAGNNGIQLSFEENDSIVILSDKSKDGWQYGQNARTRRSGWFPIAYTLNEDSGDQPLQRAGSTSDLLDSGLPLPDYADYSDGDYMSVGITEPPVVYQRPVSASIVMSSTPPPPSPPYIQNRPLPSTSGFVRQPSSTPPAVRSPSPIRYQPPPPVTNRMSEVVYSQPIVKPPRNNLIIPPPPPPPPQDTQNGGSPDNSPTIESPRINPFTQTGVVLRKVKPNDRSAPKF